MTAVIARHAVNPQTVTCLGDGPTLYWDELHQERRCRSVCPDCGSAREHGHVHYRWEVRDLARRHAG